MNDWLPQSWFEGMERTPYLLENGPWWAMIIWFAAVGGCIGSFLNVVALRVPKGEDIVVKGSRCPICEHKLRWWQNMPLIGWPLLRGKCFYCRTPIPIRYWLWELAFAALFVGAAIASPWL